MGKSYLLLGKGNKANVVSEKAVEKEVMARLARGEKVRVFEGQEMQVSFSLSRGEGSASTPKPRRKARRKTRKAKSARAAGKAKATRKKAKKAPKKKTGGKKRGPGRPKVNAGPCVVDGCDKEQRTKGLCSAHYQAHRRATQGGKPGLL